MNGYLDWILKQKKKDKSKEKTSCTQQEGSAKRPHVIVPYVKGVSEKLRQMLVHPKDKLSKDKVVTPVYHIPCNDCEDDYI